MPELGRGADPRCSRVFRSRGEFKLGCGNPGRRYNVPTDLLCRDSRWRRARLDLYRERVADYPLIARTPDLAVGPKDVGSAGRWSVAEC